MKKRKHGYGVDGVSRRGSHLFASFSFFSTMSYLHIFTCQVRKYSVGPEIWYMTNLTGPFFFFFKVFTFADCLYVNKDIWLYNRWVTRRRTKQYRPSSFLYCEHVHTNGGCRHVSKTRRDKSIETQVPNLGFAVFLL
ncbi:hypothetical protein J3459_011293 [Metarhizium acridum]|nr:hypothetical protein J3459_011293 [Metarhizium acridum]